MEIKEVESFFFRNRGYIERVLAFYNISYEEIRQECFLAFYSSPEIEKYIKEKEYKKASTLFLTNLRRQSSKFSPTGIQIRNTGSFYKVGDLEDKLKYECEDDVLNDSLEEMIANKILVESLQDVKGYRFIMDFYSFGCEFCMKKYNIPKNTVKSRKKRTIERMRKELGLC